VIVGPTSNSIIEFRNQCSCSTTTMTCLHILTRTGRSGSIVCSSTKMVRSERYSYVARCRVNDASQRIQIDRFSHISNEGASVASWTHSIRLGAGDHNLEQKKPGYNTMALISAVPNSDRLNVRALSRAGGTCRYG